MARSAIHWNSNIMCVINIRTTGDLPGYHDIIEIAILPVESNLTPSKRFIPFFCNLQPKRPENYIITDEEEQENFKVPRAIISKAMTEGLDPFSAVEIFETWFERFGIREGKKILPLAYNWPKTRDFLIDWMQPRTLNLYFDWRYRDPINVANYLNDKADLRQEPVPYAKQDMFYLYSSSGLKLKQEVTPQSKFDCLAQCERILHLYRIMVNKAFV